MKKNIKVLIASAIPGLLFVIIISFIKFLEWSFETGTSVSLALQPRYLPGLVGILTAPLIHGDWTHLFSNAVPIIVLSSAIVFFYYRLSKAVFLWLYFVPNIGVWLIGSYGNHIGASGIVYGFAGFLFFSGIFRKDRKSMAIALLVALLYGGMIWGVLPGQKGISWESHLMGALNGIGIAFFYRKKFSLETDSYSWQHLPKGNSNLTYTFDDEGQEMKIVYDYKVTKKATQKMYEINSSQYEDKKETESQENPINIQD